MRYGLAITVCLAAMAGWKAVQTDSAWLQPPVDTSSTDISISESTLFSKEKLLDGVTHIENDLSFMRGCEIKKIRDKFYHNCGFKIGSVDTMLYANFENNFEKAVFWYLRF